MQWKENIYTENKSSLDKYKNSLAAFLEIIYTFFVK